MRVQDFQSIPLKIVFPDLKVTIVDSLNKRITFLNTLVETLGLKDVQCFHDRAGNFGQNKEFRASFDVVTARAAKLSVLSEFCMLKRRTKNEGFIPTVTRHGRR